MTSDDSKTTETVSPHIDPPPPRSNDDPIARDLRGFGPLGVATFLIILLIGNYPFLPASGLLVLLWVWRSRTPWCDIGYVRPRSWVGAVSIGIAFGVVLKLLMKAFVMPLLGAPEINQAFQYLVGNRAALPGAVLAMFMAGFGEETVFRGFLFERFSKFFGTSVRAKIFIVLVTAVGFGLAHYSLQGLPGVQQATIFGLIFGTIAAITGRIVVLMIAHTAFDLTALAIIYWNLESRIAHLIFK